MDYHDDEKILLAPVTVIGVSDWLDTPFCVPCLSRAKTVKD